MARQPGEVAAVEFPLDALLQSPHHIPLGIGGGVAENPHVAAPAEVLAVDKVGSDDPLDLVALAGAQPGGNQAERDEIDRKSTRLNSSHLGISYAVFCLKKKNKDDSVKSSKYMKT